MYCMQYLTLFLVAAVASARTGNLNSVKQPRYIFDKTSNTKVQISSGRNIRDEGESTLDGSRRVITGNADYESEENGATNHINFKDHDDECRCNYHDKHHGHMQQGEYSSEDYGEHYDKHHGDHHGKHHDKHHGKHHGQHNGKPHGEHHGKHHGGNHGKHNQNHYQSSEED